MAKLRPITLFATRMDFGFVVLTENRSFIGYGSQVDCEDYVARKSTQKAMPGAFVQELKAAPVRKQYRIAAGTYAAKTLKGVVLHKGTQAECETFAHDYAVENHTTVRVACLNAGQGLVEYALLAALIALVLFMLLSWSFGTANINQWQWLFLNHPAWAVVKEIVVRLHMLWLVGA